jgi:putative ABC transport system permease protein
MTTLPNPPRVPRAIMRRAVPNEARDAVDGDLHELYVARRAASGAAVANTWYWLESLSFLMRFSIDRIARVFRGLAGADARPSVLDLKLGARMLAKSPGLSIVGGFGMAIGVALSVGGYAAVNLYFYPTLPLNEGDRIVAIGKFDARRSFKDTQVLHDFLAWRRDLRSLVDLGAFRTIRRNIITEAGLAGDPVIIAEMTASGFRVARVPPLKGRVLLDSDEGPGAQPVVVIGYDVWQARFAGDPAIVGREIRLGRSAHTIVGVMPQGFAFPVNHNFWIPLRVGPSAHVEPGTGPNLDVFGRLATGVSKESAQAELSAIDRRLAAEGPAGLADRQSRIIPYTDVFMNAEAGSENVTFGFLRFLITILLVIVAMNVAVLVYARTVARTGEIAVRTALGATRGRIVAQLFAEAFILSGISALVGLGIVVLGLRMLDRFLDTLGGAPFWIHSGISLGTILYTLVLAVLSAVIIGVFPALRATGGQLRAAIGSLGSGTKARLGATWTALIVTQVTIAVGILPPALLKGGRSLQMALREPDFAIGEYVSTSFWVERETDAINTARADSAAADSAGKVVTALLARLMIEPGVIGTSVTRSIPWEGDGRPLLEVDGADAPSQRVRIAVVDTSYFGLFGVRVLAGRGFTSADAALRPDDRPVIVNRSFVTEMMSAGDPVGRRVRYRNDDGQEARWLTIAGVVEDFPEAIKTPGQPSARMMYHLSRPEEWGGATLTIRLRGQTPEAFVPTLRRLATSVDPMLQLSRTIPLDAAYREYARTGLQLALVVALIAGSVLLLCAAGIHALMSFTVNQRRREIGIRSALGAPAHRILATVLARAAHQLTLGMAVGLTMAVGLDVATGGELMNGTELLLVPGTAVFMLVVGGFAAAGPARRGLDVQPTEALRSE